MPRRRDRQSSDPTDAILAGLLGGQQQQDPLSMLSGLMNMQQMQQKQQQMQETMPLQRLLMEAELAYKQAGTQSQQADTNYKNSMAKSNDSWMQQIQDYRNGGMPQAQGNGGSGS